MRWRLVLPSFVYFLAFFYWNFKLWSFLLLINTSHTILTDQFIDCIYCSFLKDVLNLCSRQSILKAAIFLVTFRYSELWEELKENSQQTYPKWGWRKKQSDNVGTFAVFSSGLYLFTLSPYFYCRQDSIRPEDYEKLLLIHKPTDTCMLFNSNHTYKCTGNDCRYREERTLCGLREQHRCRSQHFLAYVHVLLHVLRAQIDCRYWVPGLNPLVLDLFLKTFWEPQREV